MNPNHTNNKNINKTTSNNQTNKQRNSKTKNIIQEMSFLLANCFIGHCLVTICYHLGWMDKRSEATTSHREMLKAYNLLNIFWRTET